MNTEMILALVVVAPVVGMVAGIIHARHWRRQHAHISRERRIQ